MRSIRQIGVGNDGIVTVLYEGEGSDVFDISKMMEGAAQAGMAMDGAAQKLDRIAAALELIAGRLDSLQILLADYINYSTEGDVMAAYPIPEVQPVVDFNDEISYEPIEKMEVDRG